MSQSFMLSQLIMRFWEPATAHLWTLDIVEDFYIWIHIFAWVLLYGTSLMLDFPDLVGMSEVIVIIIIIIIIIMAKILFTLLSKPKH